MEFNEWLANTPEFFPETFRNRPPNHSCFIGSDQIYTITHVRDVLRFIEHATVKGNENELQLSDSETSGIDLIIRACSDALDFEITCRPDGGDPVDDDTGATSTDI